MLSLPNQGGAGAGGNPVDPNNPGTWAVLTPKRSQQLIARERDIAIREAEIARREAELLAGAPGGVIPNAPSCPPCIMEKVAPEPIMMPPPPVQTVIKEVVKEDALTPPGWWKDGNDRFDDILARELKIAERERDISRREETVNRREHDASRRESWIMEQLAYVAFQPMTFFNRSFTDLRALEQEHQRGERTRRRGCLRVLRRARRSATSGCPSPSCKTQGTTALPPTPSRVLRRRRVSAKRLSVSFCLSQLPSNSPYPPSPPSSGLGGQRLFFFLPVCPPVPIASPDADR